MQETVDVAAGTKEGNSIVPLGYPHSSPAYLRAPILEVSKYD